jgi:hypothetical protein
MWIGLFRVKSDSAMIRNLTSKHHWIVLWISNETATLNTPISSQIMGNSWLWPLKAQHLLQQNRSLHKLYPRVMSLSRYQGRVPIEMVHIYGSLESAKHHMSTSELVLTLTMSDCNIFTIFSHKPSLSIHYPQLYSQLTSHMYARIVRKLGFNVKFSFVSVPLLQIISTCMAALTLSYSESKPLL